VNRRMEAPSAHTDDAPKLLARILKGVAGPPWQVACATGPLVDLTLNALTQALDSI
jgi:hypothetical protein